MARVNGQQWLEKWGRRMNAAGQDMAAGVDRVQTAPGEAAANAQALFAQRIAESISNGSWARGVRSVSLSDWKTSMKEKGIPRIGQGVTQAQRTKLGRINATLAAVDTAASEANAMPKGNIEASIARASTFMRRMSALAPKKTGGGTV
jgi:hypothetical protein